MPNNNARGDEMKVTYPKTTQTLTGYSLAGSASNVALLPGLGFDFAKYGTPKRAAIRPEYRQVKFVGPVHGKAGLVGYAGDIIWQPVFEDCEFTVVTVPQTHTAESKWGAIPYGLHGATFKRCVFRNIPKEHGIYPHGMSGDTLFEDCVFENIGAQAIQVAERWMHHGGPETWDAKALTIPGSITLRRCLVRNCGKPSGVGRASFALTFFGPQSDAGGLISPISAIPIIVENSSVEHRDSLGGAFIAQRRPMWTLRGSRFNYRTTGGGGSKPLLFSEKSLAGLIEDYHADVGKHDILDMPAGKLVLRNVSGNATVRIGKTGPDGKVKYTTIGTLGSIGSATV